MKPNYPALEAWLKEHPDYVFESEVRDNRQLVDFTNMTSEELDEWNRWLSAKGYEAVEYVDKTSGLLDSVWINENHQQAIKKLEALEKRFHDERKYYGTPKRKITAIADECMEIITTLHSMVLAKEVA